MTKEWPIQTLIEVGHLKLRKAHGEAALIQLDLKSLILLLLIIINAQPLNVLLETTMKDIASNISNPPICFMLKHVQIIIFVDP